MPHSGCRRWIPPPVSESRLEANIDFASPGFSPRVVEATARVSSARNPGQKESGRFLAGMRPDFSTLLVASGTSGQRGE